MRFPLPVLIFAGELTSFLQQIGIQHGVHFLIERGRDRTVVPLQHNSDVHH
jgi:hypothetical protein